LDGVYGLLGSYLKLWQMHKKWLLGMIFLIKENSFKKVYGAIVDTLIILEKYLCGLHYVFLDSQPLIVFKIYTCFNGLAHFSLYFY